MRIVLLFLLGALMLLGCNSNDTPDTIRDQQQELDFNQTKWANANLSSYQFTSDRTCFCAPEEAIIVGVTNDTVTSAFFTPSGVPLDDSRVAQLWTIDEYFGLIQTGLDDAFNVLEVEYDEVYGYPTRIYVDPGQSIADDEVEYLNSDLQ